MTINSINQMKYEGVRRPSIKDNIKYGFKKTYNARNSAVKDIFVTAAGLGASIGAAASVKNSKTAQTFLKNVFNKAAGTSVGKSVLGLTAKAKPLAQKALTYVKNMPGPAKAVLALGVAVTGLLHANNRAKAYYNQGKIDQEYRDLYKK